MRRGPGDVGALVADRATRRRARCRRSAAGSRPGSAAAQSRRSARPTSDTGLTPCSEPCGFPAPARGADRVVDVYASVCHRQPPRRAPGCESGLLIFVELTAACPCTSTPDARSAVRPYRRMTRQPAEGTRSSPARWRYLWRATSSERCRPGSDRTAEGPQGRRSRSPRAELFCERGLSPGRPRRDRRRRSASAGRRSTGTSRTSTRSWCTPPASSSPRPWRRDRRSAGRHHRGLLDDYCARSPGSPWTAQVGGLYQWEGRYLTDEHRAEFRAALADLVAVSRARCAAAPELTAGRRRAAGAAPR